MRDNLFFILIVFFFIVIIFIFFPNQKSQKIQVDKDDIIIKVEKNNNYAAIISKDNNLNNNEEKNKIYNSPSNSEPGNFEISNIKILDYNQESKNTFIFNENIFIYLDYVLPDGFFTFKVKTIPELKIKLKDDILRTKKGSTEKNPLVFSVSNTEDLKDIIIDEINIQIFKTDEYENPVFNYIYPANITIKNLKVNLIREDDYTSPLILSNT